LLSYSGKTYWKKIIWPLPKKPAGRYSKKFSQQDDTMVGRFQYIQIGAKKLLS